MRLLVFTLKEPEIISGIIERGFYLRTHFHAQTRVADCIDDEIYAPAQGCEF
jgi:hypothetical protein